MSDMFQYRKEINLLEIVDEQVQKIQQRVDEATLDKAADTLAKFGYVKVDGNNKWFKLFGTPERTARTLHESDDWTCTECPIHNQCKANWPHEPCLTSDYDRLLEWLRSDAE